MIRGSTVAFLLCMSSCGSEKVQADTQRKIPESAEPICTTAYDPLAGLSLTRTFSYLAIRADRHTARPVAAADVTLFEHGVPCADATDRAACEERLATLRAQGGMFFGEEQVYFVGMLRDDVVVFQSQFDLMKLLGPIDTASEAALTVSLQGTFEIECATARAWRSDDGWTVYARYRANGGCPSYDAVSLYSTGIMRVAEEWSEGC